MHAKKKKLQPIILCVGQGSRLWPASRVNLPKQFLKLFNGKSLFELTVEKLKSPVDCVAYSSTGSTSLKIQRI